MTLSDLTDRGWITVLDENGDVVLGGPKHTIPPDDGVRDGVEGYEKVVLNAGSGKDPMDMWLINSVEFTHIPTFPELRIFEYGGDPDVRTITSEYTNATRGRREPSEGSTYCMAWMAHGFNIYTDTPAEDDGVVANEQLRFKVTGEMKA